MHIDQDQPPKFPIMDSCFAVALGIAGAFFIAIIIFTYFI